MNEKKNINLPILCALLLIIITGAVGYLYYRVFFQMPRDITFCLTSHETLSYQLFDNQFSHILTTITILIAMFGLAIPLATYFFQQKNLDYERQKIKDEIDELKEIKKDFPKMKEDFEKIKSKLTNIQNNINSFNNSLNDISGLLIEFAYDKFKNNVDVFFQKCAKAEDEGTKSLKGNYEFLSEALRNLANLIFILYWTKDKDIFKFYFNKIAEKLQEIENIPGIKILLMIFASLNNLEDDFFHKQELKDFLGEDSDDFKDFLNIFSFIYDAYDEQSKKSSVS